MKILCLDLSTHCGWALFEGEVGSKPALSGYGTIHLEIPTHKFGKYPFCYRSRARAQIEQIINKLLIPENPDVVIVEETNGGKNRYSQKLLEFLHYRLVEALEERGRQTVYLDSSQWRHNLGLVMTKEQKKANAKLRKAMRDSKAAGTKLDKKALGIKGLVNKKHIAINHANQIYDLKLKVKDNDAADAICLGLAFCNHATPCDGV